MFSSIPRRFPYTYIVVAQPFNRRLDHTNRRPLVQHDPTFVGDPLSAENLDLLT